MAETLQPFGEQEPRPVWKDLIEIEKLIANEMKRIDTSGPDFLAREELLEKLRKRYNWYEKWASSTSLDRATWAQEVTREAGRNAYSSYSYKVFDQAEKNYETALGAYAPGGISKTLNKIENATIDDSVRVLEKIKTSANNTEINIKKIAKELLAYILEFQRQVIYLDFTDKERDDLEENIEMIESNIDDHDLLAHALPIFIDKLIEILREKKKKEKE